MVELIILAGLVIVAFMVINTALKIVGVVILIATWMCAGYLAGKIIRGQDYGPIGDAALGLAGGIIGNVVLSILGLGSLGNIWLVGGILIGTVGAIILIYVVRMFSDNKEFGK